MSTQITGTSITTPTIDLTTPLAVADGGTGTLVAFSASRTGNQTVTNSTWTKVQLNTEEYDTNSNFDSTTNYRFQPTVAGYYQFSGTVAVGTSAITSCISSIYKNGSVVFYGVFTTSGISNVSSLIYMNGSTDYVELWGYATATTPIFLAGAGYCIFNGILVRAS